MVRFVQDQHTPLTPREKKHLEVRDNFNLKHHQSAQNAALARATGRVGGGSLFELLELFGDCRKVAGRTGIGGSNGWFVGGAGARSMVTAVAEGNAGGGSQSPVGSPPFSQSILVGGGANDGDEGPGENGDDGPGENGDGGVVNGDGGVSGEEGPGVSVDGGGDSDSPPGGGASGLSLGTSPLSSISVRRLVGGGARRSSSSGVSVS
ncbi:MAG: hypothetical protein WD468_07845 [Pirellulales bacterium]